MEDYRNMARKLTELKEKINIDALNIVNNTYRYNDKEIELLFKKVKEVRKVLNK